MHATSLNVPYGKELYWDIGPWYYVLAAFMVVGCSNAVNLTDGMDGLAAGSVIFCAITYGIFAYMAGNVKFASYLRLVHVEGAGEIGRDSRLNEIGDAGLVGDRDACARARIQRPETGRPDAEAGARLGADDPGARGRARREWDARSSPRGAHRPRAA